LVIFFFKEDPSFLSDFYQVIVKLHAAWKMCEDSNGFRAKNFYVFTPSAVNIREIINSLRSGSMISAHTADSVYTEFLMLVQIV